VCRQLRLESRTRTEEEAVPIDSIGIANNEGTLLFSGVFSVREDVQIKFTFENVCQLCEIKSKERKRQTTLYYIM